MDIQKERGRLLFKIDVLTRYHDQRRAFFSNLYRSVPIVTLLGVMLAGGGVAEENSYMVATGILSIFGITLASLAFGKYEGWFHYGFGGAVQFHERLYRSLMELEADMAAAGELSKEHYTAFKARKLAAEREHTNVFWGVYTVAQNTALSARGYKASCLTFWQKLFANFFRMSPMSFEPIRFEEV